MPPLFVNLAPGDLTATSGAFICAFAVLGPVLLVIGVCWLMGRIANALGCTPLDDD